MKEQSFSKKIFISFIISALVFSFSFSLQAGENDNPWIDAEEVSNNRLEQQLDQYLGERGWELGVSTNNPNNAYLGWGYSEIKASPGDKEFGQSRILAFEDAFAEAKGEFVSYRQSEITTETVSEFMLDELPEPETSSDNWHEYMLERADIALEKALDLGEAQLDELLERFDIDPDQYRDAERRQQEQILYDAISSRTVTEAMEQSAGLIVEATFEDNNGVGVLVKYSGKTENIARQISRGDPATLGVDYDARKYTDTHLNNLDDENVPFVYGVRLMENNEGENVLVAFGQWSPAVTETTSDTIADARIEAAKDMARSRAEAALTNFVNNTVVMENISEVVEEQQVYEETMEGREQQVETYQIGQYVENVVEQYGEVTLEGITTIDRWTTNHVQTGHLLVGHIMKWSPATRDAARGDFEEDIEETDDEEEEEEDEGDVIESPF